MKNKLYILEGVDASGKTTQAELLAKRLGWVELALPNYNNETGALLEVMKNTSKEGVSEEYFQAVMMANYIDVTENQIIPALEAGQNVVMTRAWSSMRAYSKHFGVCEGFVENLINGYKKYLSSKGIYFKEILIDIPVEVAMDRVKKRGKIEKVFENYPTLTAVGENMKKNIGSVVDGTQSIEEVYGAVLMECGSADDRKAGGITWYVDNSNGNAGFKAS